MRNSIIERAAIASLFIAQILAAPQGRGSIDDTRALELPSVEEMVVRLSLSPSPLPTPISNLPKPSATTLLITSLPSPSPSNSPSTKKQVAKPNANKELASRGDGACKAIAYSIANGDAYTSGLKIYQFGKLLTNVANNGATSWTVDTSLPSPVTVSMTVGTPGTIESCSGSYVDQTELEGWVGAGYEEFSGLSPAGTSTCEINFEC